MLPSGTNMAIKAEDKCQKVYSMSSALYLALIYRRFNKDETNDVLAASVVVSDVAQKI